jgi:hypothetical protein
MMDDLYYAMQDFHRLTEANDALQAQVEQRDAEIAALLREFMRLRSEYMELIHAVATKHPNETRHQTALRYIMQRESQQSHGPDKALRGEGE